MKSQFTVYNTIECEEKGEISVPQRVGGACHANSFRYPPGRAVVMQDVDSFTTSQEYLKHIGVYRVTSDRTILIFHGSSVAQK